MRYILQATFHHIRIALRKILGLFPIASFVHNRKFKYSNQHPSKIGVVKEP